MSAGRGRVGGPLNETYLRNAKYFMANRCPNQSLTIDDGCGGTVTCNGTRTCDFNWKEVGQ